MAERDWQAEFDEAIAKERAAMDVMREAMIAMSRTVSPKGIVNSDALVQFGDRHTEWQRADDAVKKLVEEYRKTG